MGCNLVALFANIWQKAQSSCIEVLVWCSAHRLVSSDANAFRTSDCEIPNCRAIRDGVTPALNAARLIGGRHSWSAALMTVSGAI
jgi:hypothetical protein